MLQHKLETLDGVDEVDHRHYKLENDGIYYLQADVSGLTKTIDAERKIRSRLESQIKELQTRIAESQNKQLEQEQKPDQKQPTNQIVERVKADYEAKLADMQQKQQALQKKMALSEFTAELTKKGVVPQSVELLTIAAQSNLKFNDDTLEVVDNNGNPLSGLSDLAEIYVRDHSYLIADKGIGGSGRQPQTTGGMPKTKSFNDYTSAELVELARTDPEVYKQIRPKR